MLDVVGPFKVDRQAAGTFGDADRRSRDGQVQLGPRNSWADLRDLLPPPSSGIPFQPGRPIGFERPVGDKVEAFGIAEMPLYLRTFATSW